MESVSSVSLKHLLDPRLIGTGDTLDDWQLLGSSCQDCGRKFQPPRALCPGCGRATEHALLAQTGTVVVSTLVAQPAVGLLIECPYQIGLIQLDEGGPVIEAVAVRPLAPSGALPPGTRVELVLSELEVPLDGERVLFYRYRPIEAGSGGIQ
ncbi:MAG: hypothetical protein GEU28_05395 [Dehalococcoidia bacterium]|nr:hypothetical protein [Dehalococcoidia bacterium]